MASSSLGLCPHQRGFERRPADFSSYCGPRKLGRRFAVLTTSASARDFRFFDMEREEKCSSTARGAIGDGSGNSEADPPERHDEEPMVQCTNTRAVSQWKKFFTLWKRKSVRRLPSFPPLGVPRLSKKKTRNSGDGINPSLSQIYNLNSQLVHFTLSELELATENFSKENLIGHGGFAQVFKGRLKSGQFVAVKRLTKGTADEKTASFLSELGVIAHLNHPNIAKLVGCCVEGGLHLVLQLSPLGSLGNILHGSKCHLDWGARYKIALGTANGLQYLHESCQRRIIHRDIKADNILLAEDFEPQICDFGLAKWLPTQWTHRNATKFEGTFGYFAPEYFMHGIFDEKTDVYAFGVLLLELITGRKAVDSESKSLVLWAKPLLDNDGIAKLVDPSLSNDYNSEEMDRVIMTASFCIDQSAVLRPQMNQVAVLIRGEKFVNEFTKDGQRRTFRRTYSEELSDALEYNSTRYLSDLRRHKEVALGS
ncbi:hypothetical protein MLD38_016491 [Melastoma candidum]|uniref:Uncharacterized protein n=1 Tax=Melastoma candidum TaxID=119954 RepID=A0ACB9QNT1_9MYRT|nr:hypothetical protein MLD38_016491 [Melastoma candidum]